MEQLVAPIITIVCSLAASGGFWAWLQKRGDKKDAKSKMILGLGHDRILFLCVKYIDRGYVTRDELENLYEYLYTPYQELGGNGTVTRLMRLVDSLPLNPPNKEGGKDGKNGSEQ